MGVFFFSHHDCVCLRSRMRACVTLKVLKSTWINNSDHTAQLKDVS